MRTCVLTLSLLLASAGPSLIAAEVDTSPLPIEVERAFPELNFKRPIVLTHANDGSDRVFVASQLGSVHVFPNDQKTEESKVFLDISAKTDYEDKENEEGFLGMAFHPKYKENGQFFVYYTTTEDPHTSIISRFNVSKSDPDKADPASEVELMRIKQPYWNHNGGTIEFGPDGFLYIVLGDGGAGNDPHGNGQSLATVLGKILRIDVDNKDGDKKYAIPKDNPFVGQKEAKPEIYAYGLRNVWRLSFDRETGTGWMADVGQDIWEEIDILEKGGNYGWNIREGMHKFTPKSNKVKPGRVPESSADAKLIDPIWEYHHDIGKSITGGNVYRGKRLPELVGYYLYADYVTGKLWALKYDAKAGKVTENRTIAGNIMPVLSFGEDQSGEVYYLVDTGTIHRFRKTKADAAKSK